MGHVTRFEDRTCSDTLLRFSTDEALCREALEDPLLERYSVIILDEAKPKLRCNIVTSQNNTNVVKRKMCIYLYCRFMLYSYFTIVLHLNLYFFVQAKEAIEKIRFCICSLTHSKAIRLDVT